MNRLRMFRSLTGVVLLAIGLRLIAACALQYYLDHVANPPRPYLIMGDAEGYWDLAGDITHGREYAVYQPPRRVLRMPGFPALLSVSRLIAGDHLFAARLLLAVCGGLSCGLVWLLGRTLVNEQIGATAGLLAAISPTFIGFSAEILSETSFAGTMVLGLWLAAKLRDSLHQPTATGQQSLSLAFATGLATALACYMRPSWLLAAPLVAGLVLVLPFRAGDSLSWTRRSLLAGLILLGTFAALLPWGIRNQRVTGHFTLTTFWMGASLYDGLNPEQQTGDSNMAFFDRDNLLAVHSEYEVDQIYRQRAQDFARNQPYKVLELAVSKAWRYWKPTPNADQFQSLWVRLVVAGFYVPMLLLALKGGWNLRRDLWTLVLTAGPILYFCGLHLVFVSSLRYRLPAEYPLLVLTAVGLGRADHPRCQTEVNNLDDSSAARR